MSWPQSWCVNVCRVCVCVCVDGFVCLQAVDSSELCLMIPLRCLSVTSGMDAVRSEARSLQTCIQHVDGSHTTLFAGAARLHKHTLSHTCLLSVWAEGRYTGIFIPPVCVCVMSVVYWEFHVFLLKIPAG